MAKLKLTYNASFNKDSVEQLFYVGMSLREVDVYAEQLHKNIHMNKQTASIEGVKVL